MQPHRFLVHDAGPLEEGRDRAATQPAARLRLALARVEAGPVSGFQCAIEQVREVAAVVGFAHRVAIGHLLGPHQVAPAQFGRVELELRSRAIHQPLDQVDRFGPARAAIRADDIGVRQHCLGLQVEHRHVVDAGRDLRPDRQMDDCAGRVSVGADRARDAHAQREDAAVGIEREFALGALVAAMARRLEFLEPRRPPAHRAPQLARRVRADDILRMHQRFHAEAATDIADDDPHLLGRQIEQLGERALVAGRVLRSRVKGEPSRGRVKFGDAAARLERHRSQPLVVDRHAHLMSRRGKCALASCAVPVVRAASDVARCIGPDHGRRRRERGIETGHRRQRVVIDHH